jgi:uncharacterized membrane protein YgcG
MTPEEIKARSCDGKRRYRTKRGADGVVLEIARQQRDESIRAYKCQFCGYWHVGHRKASWQR